MENGIACTGCQLLQIQDTYVHPSLCFWYCHECLLTLVCILLLSHGQLREQMLLQTLVDQSLNPGSTADTKAVAKPGSKVPAKPGKTTLPPPDALPEKANGPVPADLVIAARLQLCKVSSLLFLPSMHLSHGT